MVPVAGWGIRRAAPAGATAITLAAGRTRYDGSTESPGAGAMLVSRRSSALRTMRVPDECDERRIHAVVRTRRGGARCAALVQLKPSRYATHVYSATRRQRAANDWPSKKVDFPRPRGLKPRSTLLRRCRRARKRRRQRRRIDVAARAVRTNRAGSETEVRRVDVVLAARVFLDLFVGLPEHPGPRVGERSRVELRILDQRVDVDVVGVRAASTARRRAARRCADWRSRRSTPSRP